MQSSLIFSGFTIIIKYDTYIGKVRLFTNIIETTFDKKCGNYGDFCPTKKRHIDEFCKNEAARLEEIHTLAIQLAAIIMTYTKLMK